MRTAALFAMGLLCLSGPTSAEPLPVNRDKVWFKPSLALNTAPVCEDLLRIEQDAFFSVGGQPDYERGGFRKIREPFNTAEAVAN